MKDFNNAGLKLASDKFKTLPPFKSSQSFRFWNFTYASLLMGLTFLVWLPFQDFTNLSVTNILKGVEFKNMAYFLFGYTALFVGWYKYEMGKFSSKWQYLASLYNDITTNKENSSEELYEFRITALALDSIVSEMWAHESFSLIARDQLEKSIHFYFDRADEYQNKILENDKYEALGKLDYGLLTEDEAKNYLFNYQSDLSGKIKNKDYNGVVNYNPLKLAA